MNQMKAKLTTSALLVTALAAGALLAAAPAHAEMSAEELAKGVTSRARAPAQATRRSWAGLGLIGMFA